MADEHKAWLDGATAEELLRGRAAAPVGPGADPRARAEAARLRAALDALTPRTADRGELPGEAAALAAFRAAHATRAAAPATAAPAAGRSGAPGAGVPDEPLIDLAPIPVVRIPAQRRHGTPARFGLAAALAGVAVGGIAAVAGTGLLDRDARLSAGPAPAVSVSADSERTPAAETAGPTSLPQLRPTPEGGGGLASLGPGFSLPPDGRGRTPLDPGGSLPPGTVTTPATGGGTTGTDGGTRNTLTDKNDGTKDGGAGGKDRDQQDTDRPETLCRDHAANKLAEDRKQYLARIAGGPAKIPRFCATLLEAPRSGTPQGGSTDQGGVVVPSPVLSPAGPLGFRTR
ncbi:hypothetical protein BX286_4523 [Streptomyces sp. 3211.6]|uniref:hypothetical protein n=1 Tax=Streptomyces TaxID=1883 RepID=UPI0009A47B34|nr:MULTISPECIES: hypothetical protein [Streptomyces]RKT06481.1 hypothetical protein BX286_4523 [Streptomyces sp. 3211.6]